MSYLEDYTCQTPSCTQRPGTHDGGTCLACELAHEGRAHIIRAEEEAAIARRKAEEIRAGPGA